MKFEDLLLEIGGFGRFQILILFILCLPRINLPMHFLLHNFLAATPSHHCAIPHQEAFVNLTMEEVLLISIPREPDGTFKSCEMFLQPQFHLLLNSSLQPENNSIIQHCQHGWVYDHSQFTSTISTQWDLVCEQRGLNQATATIFFIGVTIGAVVFGYLSDRFGRKAMLLVSLVFSVIFGMLSAASVSYSMLAITRTLTGVALSGVSLIVLPLGMEWVDVQHRTFSGILTSIFWSIGNMLLAMVAYLVREWHWLLVAVTGPCLLSIVCLWPSEGWQQKKSQEGVTPTSACSGHQSCGRSLCVLGLCALTSLRSVVAIMGKGFSEAAFTTVFLYTSELYPTVLRQNGMGYTSFVARLGGALAPLVFLLDEVWKSLPEVTYCGVAVCCGSVAFLLPETLNVRLPEGIEDIEKGQAKGPPQISAPEGLPLQSLLK